MPNFTDAMDVSPGDAILAAHVDNLAGNTEFNREYADVGHEFGISTATGYHRGAWDNPLILKASASSYLAEWLDNTDTGNIVKRMKSGTNASAAGTPGSCRPTGMTDGVIVGGGGIS